jgi:hypothetical protein
VEKALVPPSRYCVVEHVTHGLLGDVLVTPTLLTLPTVRRVCNAVLRCLENAVEKALVPPSRCCVKCL